MANPHKPVPVASILRKNKDKLLVYLTEFHKDRDGKLDDDGTRPCADEHVSLVIDPQFNVSTRDSDRNSRADIRNRTKRHIASTRVSPNPVS